MQYVISTLYLHDTAVVLQWSYPKKLTTQINQKISRILYFIRSMHIIQKWMRGQRFGIYVLLILSHVLSSTLMAHLTSK